MLRAGPEDGPIHTASGIISARRPFRFVGLAPGLFRTGSVPWHTYAVLPDAETLFSFPTSLGIFSFDPPSLSLPLQFEAALHQRVLSIPAGSCSAAPVDLQLLSNTYCQASETCNLSFARRRPANSIHYINKKNYWCSTGQELVFISLRVRENAGLRDT